MSDFVSLASHVPSELGNDKIGSFSVLAVELWALRDGLKLAKDLKLPKN